MHCPGDAVDKHDGTHHDRRVTDAAVTIALHRIDRLRRKPGDCELHHLRQGQNRHRKQETHPFASGVQPHLAIQVEQAECSRLLLWLYGKLQDGHEEMAWSDPKSGAGLTRSCH